MPRKNAKVNRSACSSEFVGDPIHLKNENFMLIFMSDSLYKHLQEPYSFVIEGLSLDTPC